MRLQICLVAFFCLSLFARAQRFQQQVYYEIHAQLNDRDHRLSARLRMDYLNNSPDTLRELWMHLYPRAYQRGTALDRQLLKQGEDVLHRAPDSARGEMDSLDFQVDGKQVNWHFHPQHRDVAKIELPKPLPPGAQVRLKTPFRIKFPTANISRLGHSGQQYQVTQWYPKPAVYNAEGWHYMPYLNQGEFFSEVGAFDVYLTLPENYRVAATGQLINTDEIARRREWTAQSARKTYFPPHKGEFPRSSKRLKTVHFRESEVHDFAWFADKRYNILIDTIALASGKSVEASVFFTNDQAESWRKALKYLSRSVQDYSQWVGPYPYNTVCAVDGALSAGAGMEYPTITVIPGLNDTVALDRVIAHEVGHNWFYGMLASDERAHPWIDEGINSAYEYRYMQKYYPDFNPLEFLPEDFIRALDVQSNRRDLESYTLWLWMHRLGRDQPATDSAQHFSNLNYGAIVYYKTGKLIEHLRATLGDYIFDACMHRFYLKWRFRHPEPKDFFEHFQACSGENLDWLKESLQSLHTVDYRISGKKIRQDSLFMRIRNRGQIALPFTLGAFDGDSLIWSSQIEGFEGRSEVYIPVREATKIQIDPHLSLLETRKQNNQYYLQKPFPKLEPLRFKGLLLTDDPEESEIVLQPYYHWNQYNKNSLGLRLSNRAIIRKAFEYDLKPMYSFGSNLPVGHLSLSWLQRLSAGPFEHFSLSYYFQSYDFALNRRYLRYSPTLSLRFRQKDYSRPYRSGLRLRMVHLQRQANQLSLFPGTFYQDPEYSIYELRYWLEKGGAIRPWDLDLTAQYHPRYLRLSAQFEIDQHIGMKRPLELRLFAGHLIESNTTEERGTEYYDYGLSGTTDHTFDYMFYARSDRSGFMSQQFYGQDGGFRQQTGVFTGRSLLAANLDLPLWRIFGFYGDFAMLNQRGREAEYDLFFGGGASLRVIPDFLEFYFPIFNQDELLFKDPYGTQIRWLINLDFEDILDAAGEEAF